MVNVSPQLNNSIVVITELFLPTKGGTAVWFDEVYRRLGGKEISIITKAVAGDDEYDRSHPNTIHRLDLRRHWWMKPESLMMYLKFLFAGLSVVMRGNIREVHAGRVLPEGLVAWLIARICGKRVVVYAHGEEITCWRTPWKLRAMTFAYRHADLVIANSSFTRQELLKLGVDAKKIVLISPGVNVERFHPGYPVDDLRAAIKLGMDQRLILSVGRLQRRKGFDNLIRALPRLIEEGADIKLALIGIGEDEDYLAGLVRDAGILNRVVFLGHVPTEDLPRWYNLCDVFAMPNRDIDGDVEGFGMVFLEAAACGKPVLAGDTGGTADAVKQGVTGLRVDGNNIDAIADGLLTLLTDRERSKIMGLAGYQRAVTEFSWEAVAAKTRSLVLTPNVGSGQK